MYVPIIFSCTVNCTHEASTTNLAVISHHSKPKLSDEQLIDSMIFFCSTNFQDINPQRLDIIHEYYTSCVNEDAAEGIYLRTAESLKSNDKLLDLIIQLGINNGDDYNSNFVDNLLLCFMYLNDKPTPTITDLLKLIPKDFIRAFYKGPKEAEHLQSVLDLYSKNASD